MPRKKQTEAATPKQVQSTAVEADMQRVCFVMDKSIYRELRHAAIEQDTTVSDVLRQASFDYARQSREVRRAH